MFVDYGDLSGNSAEAVSKWEESSAQTNAATPPPPVEERKADGTHRPDPRGEYPACGTTAVSAWKSAPVVKTHIAV